MNHHFLTYEIVILTLLPLQQGTIVKLSCRWSSVSITLYCSFPLFYVFLSLPSLVYQKQVSTVMTDASFRGFSVVVVVLWGPCLFVNIVSSVPCSNYLFTVNWRIYSFYLLTLNFKVLCYSKCNHGYFSFFINILFYTSFILLLIFGTTLYFLLDLIIRHQHLIFWDTIILHLRKVKLDT